MNTDPSNSSRAARLTASRFLQWAAPQTTTRDGSTPQIAPSKSLRSGVADPPAIQRPDGSGATAGAERHPRSVTVTLLAAALASWTTGAAAQEARDAQSQPGMQGERNTERQGATDANSIEVRRVLEPYASEAAARRYLGSVGGLAASGALLGIGFAAQGPDMTAAHWLWASSAFVAAGSVAGFFVRSELEKLRDDAATLSDDEQRARWRQLADEARLGRKVGAVLSATLGIASMVTGGVILGADVGDFGRDDRTALGAVLLSGGALSVAGGLSAWFVPTPIETGYGIIDPDRGVSLRPYVAPIVGGAGVGFTGRF